MNTFFDQPLSRQNTNSVKIDYCDFTLQGNNLIPAWVADTDFPCPQSVIQAMHQSADQAIYGYTYRSNQFIKAICDWYWRRHHQSIAPHEIMIGHGVVNGIAIAIQAFTRPDDAIIIQPPVYPPFFSLIHDNERKVVTNALQPHPEGYRLDIDHLESQITSETKMLLFCSPHNPVSRVWRKAELEAIVALCRRYDLLLISDEIHSDLIYPPNQFISMLNYKDDLNGKLVILNSAAKTFNIAGLDTSFAIIPDEKLRKNYIKAHQRMGIKYQNLFGIRAYEAAYQCDQYVTELLQYLQNNIEIINQYIHDYDLPFYLIPPEGTYLGWLDFHPTGLTQQELKSKIIGQAKVGLMDGRAYGEDGKGYYRFNFGTQADTIHTIMQRLVNVFKNE